MNTVLKIMIAVCAVGIAAVLGVVLLFDNALGLESPPGEDSTPSITVMEPSPSDSQDSQELQPTETADDAQEVDASRMLTFSIVEVTAVCDAGGEYGVSPLPLGADWRTTERGVYSNSPVTLTCETSGETDNLAYVWSTNFGEIDGVGERVVWTAPDHGAKARVTVAVRNSAGLEQKATLNFRVVTCDCLFDRY